MAIFVDAMDLGVTSALKIIATAAQAALMPSQVSNHYAAMPSMHFGYASWVSLTLLRLARGALKSSTWQWVRPFTVHMHQSQ